MPSGTVDGLGDASTITVTYQFTPTGGSWNPGLNGTYSVSLNSSVSDLAGNATVAGSIGTFQVHAVSAGVIAATPGGSGVSAWNGVSWTPLTNGLPAGIYSPVVLASNASGDAVATFAGNGAPAGIWFWNGTIWSQINTMNASVLALSSTDTVVADFAGTGVWEYNGSSWSNIKTNDATLLGIGKNGVIVANFNGAGVWLYNGSSWAQINTLNADVLAIASDTNTIAADFAGSGVSSYAAGAGRR